MINPKTERKKVKTKRKIMHLEKERDLNKKMRKKTLMKRGVRTREKRKESVTRY